MIQTHLWTKGQDKKDKQESDGESLPMASYEVSIGRLLGGK